METATNPDDPTDVATGVGFEAEDTDTDVAIVDEATGTGLEASFKGAEYSSGVCTTAKIDRGSMTYCSIKYRVTEKNTDYNFYFYDRYAMAVGKAVNNSRDHIPTKIDIRTRPASSGSNIQAMLDYEPRGSVKNCNDVGSLTGGANGFSATIPFTECSELTGYPDGKSMRAVYDQGSIFSGRVHNAEMGVVYRTKAGVTANAAHYNYTKFCRNTYLTCDSVTKTTGPW